MKKIISSLMIVLLMFTVVGCNNKKKENLDIIEDEENVVIEDEENVDIIGDEDIGNENVIPTPTEFYNYCWGDSIEDIFKKHREDKNYTLIYSSVYQPDNHTEYLRYKIVENEEENPLYKSAINNNQNLETTFEFGYKYDMDFNKPKNLIRIEQRLDNVKDIEIYKEEVEYLTEKFTKPIADTGKYALFATDNAVIDVCYLDIDIGDVLLVTYNKPTDKEKLGQEQNK